jgi:hypothetical protein
MGKPVTSKRPAAHGAINNRPVIWIMLIPGAIGGWQDLKMPGA